MKSLLKNKIVMGVITISFMGTSLLAPFTAEAAQAQKPMGGELKQTNQKHNLVDIFSDKTMQKDAALITVSCVLAAYLPDTIDTIAKGAGAVATTLGLLAKENVVEEKTKTIQGPIAITKQETGDSSGHTAAESAVTSAAVSVPIVSLPISAALESITLSVSSLNDSISASTQATEATKKKGAGKNTITDCMVYGAGQLLLKQLTNNIVTWIKGGFHGSPSFAVNTHEIFLDLADMVAGDLAREVRGIAMCRFSANFQNDLANNIELSAKHIYKFNGATKCPFPETFNINSSDFYKGVNNFTWAGMEYAMQDNGNPFGVALLSGQELALRSSEKADVRKQELSWSNGFTNMVDTDNCDYPDGYSVEDGKMYHSVTTDETLAPYLTTEVTPQETRELQKTYCKTTTPGKLIGDKLTQATGVDMDRLGAVDSLNKIIGALIERLTQDAAMGVFKAVSGKSEAKVQQNYITTQDKTAETMMMENYAIKNAKDTLELAQRNLDEAQKNGASAETLYALKQAVGNAQKVVDAVTSAESAIARQAELNAAHQDLDQALAIERGAQAREYAASKAYYDALGGSLEGGTYIQPDPATIASLKLAWDNANNDLVTAQGITAKARQRLYDAQHPFGLTNTQ